MIRVVAPISRGSETLALKVDSFEEGVKVAQFVADAVAAALCVKGHRVHIEEFDKDGRCLVRTVSVSPRENIW